MTSLSNKDHPNKMQRSDSERIAVIEEILTRMDHRLFGNGQRGIIGEHDSRIAKLENWKWWVVGIVVGLGIALGALGQHIIEAAIK